MSTATSEYLNRRCRTLDEVVRERADRRRDWRRLDQVVDQVLADIRLAELVTGDAA